MPQRGLDHWARGRANRVQLGPAGSDSDHLKCSDSCEELSTAIDRGAAGDCQA